MKPSATTRAVLRLLAGETLEEAARAEGVTPQTVKGELYAIERKQRYAAGLTNDRFRYQRGNRLTSRNA